MTALYDGIDRVILPVSDLDAACAPFERLGLVISPEVRPTGAPRRIRTIPVGGPDNLFGIELLSVPTVGEVVSPTTVVRQLRIGDAMFELLGPATPDSPIRQRPPGLNSMCSFEVDDLSAVVEQVRAAGFEVPDPRVGTLPGTR